MESHCGLLAVRIPPPSPLVLRESMAEAATLLDGRVDSKRGQAFPS